MQSENTNEIVAALIKAQSSMKAAVLNKTNPHFRNKYADLSSVLDAVRPLTDNGIAITQTIEIRDGGLVLMTMLRHSSGQWIGSEYPLPVGVKPQELGSALTYARRYSISCIACISADEDDDAEGARKDNQSASAPKKRPAPVQHDPFTGEIDDKEKPELTYEMTAEEYAKMWDKVIQNATNAEATKKRWISEEDTRNKIEWPEGSRIALQQKIAKAVGFLAKAPAK